jgi:hypothetical protein
MCGREGPHSAEKAPLETVARVCEVLNIKYWAIVKRKPDIAHILEILRKELTTLVRFERADNAPERYDPITGRRN